MSATYQNNDTAALITNLVGHAGLTDVKTLHPHDLSVILSGLKAYKLEKEAIALVFEYLQ